MVWKVIAWNFAYWLSYANVQPIELIHLHLIWNNEKEVLQNFGKKIITHITHKSWTMKKLSYAIIAWHPSKQLEKFVDEIPNYSSFKYNELLTI